MLFKSRRDDGVGESQRRMQGDYQQVEGLVPLKWRRLKTRDDGSFLAGGAAFYGVVAARQCEAGLDLRGETCRFTSIVARPAAMRWRRCKRCARRRLPPARSAVRPRC